MKKKILGAVLSVGAIVGLASCTEAAHQHEFSKEWSSNAGGHWHACECDDRIHDSFAAHTDTNKDGKCDVCTFAVEVVQEKEEHKHAYAEAWTSNAQGHWHACECDANVMGSFAGHVDENNDGKCDVCNADVEKKHEHTYATEWSKDEANHWHESTCDHKVVADKAAHTIGNDGTCSTCGYGGTAQNVATLKGVDVVADKAKTYYNIGDELSTEGVVVYETYSNTLTADTVSSTTDLSGYTVEVEDAEGNLVTGAFTNYGVYTVTVTSGTVSDSYKVTVGAVLYDSAVDALEIGLENSDKIAGGKAVVDNSGYVQEFSFEFGENYTYILEGKDEYHYQLLANGTVFGVQNIYSEYDYEYFVSAIYDADVEHLGGVYYSSLDSEYPAHGTTELLEQLLEYGQSEEAKNFKEGFANNCPVCGTHTAYTFSYSIAVGEWWPTDYNVQVTFSLDDESKAIISAEVVIAGTDYVYDEATDSYVPNTEATEPDYVKHITINQYVGERVAQNSYDPAEIIFESFDLTNAADEKYENEGTIEIVSGEGAWLFVANPTPASANANIDEIKVICTDEDGFESYYVYGSYDADMNAVFINGYVVGTYNISVYSTNVNYSFTVNVVEGEVGGPTEGGDEENESSYVGVWTNTYTHPYTEEEYYSEIVFFDDNTGYYYIENGVYAGTFEWMDLNMAYIYPIVPEEGTPEVNLGFEYDDYTNSYWLIVSDPDYNTVHSQEYTKYVEVEEDNNDFSESFFVGKWENEMIHPLTGASFLSTIQFNADGTGVFSLMGEQYSGTFTWKDINGYVVFGEVYSSDEYTTFEFEFEFDMDYLAYVLKTYKNGDEFAELEQAFTKSEESVEDNESDSSVVGTWTNSYTDPRIGMKYESSLVFDADGNGAYSFLNGQFVGTFSWFESEGYIIISDVTSIDDMAAPIIEFDLAAGWVTAQTMDYTLYHSQGYTKLVESDEEVESFLVGSWTSSVFNPRLNADVISSLVFNADGTGSYSVANGQFAGTFSWTEEAGQISIFDTVSADPNMIALDLYMVFDDYTISYQFAAYSDGIMQISGEISKDVQSDEDDNEEVVDATPVVGTMMPMNPTMLEIADATYVTTANPYSPVCFGLYAPAEGEEVFVTIEFEADVKLYCGNPYNAQEVGSGQMISVPFDGIPFWFDNSECETPTEITFTITVYKN